MICGSWIESEQHVPQRHAMVAYRVFGVADFLLDIER